MSTLLLEFESGRKVFAFQVGHSSNSSENPKRGDIRETLLES